ncbi:hypothetical protein Mgra_00006351 [Meloidogyne graminicola]|uniref:Uncharacterized protein n=1 Tax=Meloidogyne graminicola TaxID=189291 RepID=A0A8S9ZLW3_9BILA|nr:hypothetical protein Mgra_00006351 [Meloidogyne graminicola]
MMRQKIELHSYNCKLQNLLFFTNSIRRTNYLLIKQLIKYSFFLLFFSFPILTEQQHFINFEKKNSLNLPKIFRWRRSLINEESVDSIILSEQKNVENGQRQRNVAVVGSRKRPELFQTPTDRISVIRSQFRIRLSRYSNPARRMQNLTTCACPQQDSSNCGRDIGGNHSPCYFSFIVVASSADQTVNFRSTPFVVIGDSGVIEASLEAEWGTEMLFDFSTKPRFVDIYAFNLGPVFSLLDGRIVSWSETVWPVDAWSLDLTDVIPHSFYESGPFYEQRELFGRYDTNSGLNLEFSVKCIGDSMGPECDLNCKRKEGENELKTNQVDKPNIELVKNVGVQSGWTEINIFYKSWTIILGVLLIVIIILLVLTCLFCWILILRRFSSKSKRESALAGTYRRGGAPYSISGNDFGAASRLGDSILLQKPLLGNGIHSKLTNGTQKSVDTTDWAKQTKPPIAIRQQQQQQQFPIMGATNRSPSASQHWMAAAVGSVGGGGSGQIITQTQNSPDTSESDYRPSPFTTPRREALV